MDDTPAPPEKITAICVPVAIVPLPTLPSKSGHCAHCKTELWIEDSTTETLRQDHPDKEAVFLCPLCVFMGVRKAGKLNAVQIMPLAARQQEDIRQADARSDGRGSN